MINVTQSYLPPISEYQEKLKEIWSTGQLTNSGQFVNELEEALKKRLGVKHLLLVSNGTIALQLAIKVLGMKGEVITTPFSYVATVSSLVWENCTPVFVDISEKDFCINPDLIEAAITEETTGIMATHVYGYPCDTQRIEEIAKKHDLKVIYDAAHAFGVQSNGSSILSEGDISTLSFHATKVFHTGEGGAVVTNDDDLAHKLEYHRNFGHKSPVDFWGLGVNGKVSEFHAAMGLCVLPYIEKIVKGRKRVVELYDQFLLLKGKGLYRLQLPTNVTYNYSYYPILISAEEQLMRIQKALNEADIYPRRYFYPPLNKLPYITSQPSVPVAEDISSRVLCLPLYPELTEKEVRLISQMILDNLED